MILDTVAVYLLIGVIFSVVFLVSGIKKVDPATIETGLVFKLLLFPGLVITWPIFLLKWLRS